MKITKLEEYGLRCLMTVARAKDDRPVTIPSVADAEHISLVYAAKLLTILRRLKFIKSIRGVKGGYRLARKAEHISVGEVLKALGGFGLEKDPCRNFPGMMAECPKTRDCRIRPIWIAIARHVSAMLDHLSLAEIIDEKTSIEKLMGEKFSRHGKFRREGSPND